MNRDEIKARLQESSGTADPLMSESERLGFDLSAKTPLYEKPWFRGIVLFGFTSFIGLILWSTGGTSKTAIAINDQTDLEERLEQLESENTRLKGLSVAAPDRQVQGTPSKPKPKSISSKPDSPPSKPTPVRTSIPSTPIKRLPVAQTPTPRYEAPRHVPQAPRPEPIATPVPVTPPVQVAPVPKSLPLAPEPTIVEVALSEPDASKYDYVDTLPEPPTVEETEAIPITGAYEPELVAALSQEKESSPYKNFPDGYQFVGDFSTRKESTLQAQAIESGLPLGLHAKGKLLQSIVWASDHDPTGEIFEIELQDQFGYIPEDSTVYVQVKNISASSNIVDLSAVGFLHDGKLRKLPEGLFEIRSEKADFLVGKSKRKKRNDLGNRILGSVLSGGATIASDSVGNSLGDFLDGATDPLVDDISGSRYRSFSSRSNSFTQIKAGTKIILRVNPGSMLL